MRKLAFLTLGIVASAGACNTADSSEESEAKLPTIGVTQQQLDAFDRLQTATQQRWTWMQHDELKTPSHLSNERIGDAVLQPGEDIHLRTLAVLTENKDLFKMRDPALELSKSKAETDPYGMQHARFQQMAHGVPVAGAEVLAHYDANGHLTSIDANYIADLDSVDVNPSVTASDALAIVKKDVLLQTPVDESILEPDAGKLVVYTAKLAYEFKVRALTGPHPAIWVVTVDAHTGEILHRYNNLQTIQASGKGVLGDTKTFEVTQSGGQFVMNATDPTTGVSLQTFSAKSQEVAPGTMVTSSSATSWDTSAIGSGAAVDAHFNAGIVAKYYRATHARDAIDGTGGTLQSTVHFGSQFDNAAWISTGMIYGDGGEMFKALSVGLDVVGHEFTHGVTEKTSTLNYENQSGALNEAVSDIFGAFIEHSIKPDDTKNWQIGEGVTLNGHPLRDMINPNNVDDPQPTHMKQFVQTQQDSGGVHINSGVINNAAYLMTMGGTNSVSKVTVKNPIGWEKSEKLWYQANTKYFMTTTNFAQAAAGVASAAKDVGLTSAEQATVDCAFKAVGVNSGSCLSTLAASSTSSGTSSAAGDDDDDDSTTTTKKKTHKQAITTETAGCSTTGRSSDFTPLAALLAAIAVLGRRRRN